MRRALIIIATLAAAFPLTAAASPMMGAEDQALCVEQNVAPLDLLSQHGASIMRVSFNSWDVGQGVDCIRIAYEAGYRIYLTLGGYSSDPQQAAAWYAQWVRFYEDAAPLWAVGIENEPELPHDPLPAETPAQYRAVWDAAAPVVNQIAPDAILVFGEGSPWSESFIKLAWGNTTPQDAGAIGFHCYGIGLKSLPEFAGWAAGRSVPMWCSEETDWLDPATDLALALALSPNTQLVVYYYWPKPADPPPYLVPAPVSPAVGKAPVPSTPQPTTAKRPAPAALIPPTPMIVSHPARRSRATAATFRFVDATSGVAYQCRRDRQSWSRCSSPKRYSGLRDAKHTFYVRATLKGRTSRAASFSWTIRR
jgi:hypothetical protein